MKWSMEIRKFAEIDFTFTPPFCLIPGWVQSWLEIETWARFMVFFYPRALACVILHEYGHRSLPASMASDAYITIYRLARARLERMPEKPIEELVGGLMDLVNVVIAADSSLSFLTSSLVPLGELTSPQAVSSKG